MLIGENVKYLLENGFANELQSEVLSKDVHQSYVGVKAITNILTQGKSKGNWN